MIGCKPSPGEIQHTYTACLYSVYNRPKSWLQQSPSSWTNEFLTEPLYRVWAKWQSVMQNTWAGAPKKKKKSSCFTRALSCNPIWVAKPASCNPRALFATCKTVHRSGTPTFVSAQLFRAPPRAAVDRCHKPEALLKEPSEFSLSQTQEPPPSSSMEGFNLEKLPNSNLIVWYRGIESD